MLQHLLIENFVLIDRLELDFVSTLCVLTGETGAGKSLIVDALDAILGGRVQGDTIRSQREHAYLEATFTLTAGVRQLLLEFGFEEMLQEETLTISRTLSKTRSQVRLNGELASQGLIKRLGEKLVDMVSQHANQALFQPEQQRVLLDCLGAAEHQQRLSLVASAWHKLQSLNRECEALQQAEQERKRQLDFLQFQHDEIEEAALQPGEEDALKQKREVLLHAEKLIYNLNAAYYTLYAQEEMPSVCDGLTSAYQHLHEAGRHDQALEAPIRELDTLREQIKELAATLRDRADEIEANPALLEEVEERLDTLRRLKNKYGSSVEVILAHQEDLAKQLTDLQSQQERLDQLEGEVTAAGAHYREQAQQLSHSRRTIARELEPRVERELKDLGMEKTRFAVELAKRPDAGGETGIDAITFLLSPNPGEPLRPLARIASGGESSRLLLAFKLLLQESEPVPTLVFDEIDTGISGKTALVVSQKMAQLACSFQIICITHLPVIAAMAEQHLWIEKTAHPQHTEIAVIQLDEGLRIEKLAQMAGGKISPSSRKHAAEIYTSASQYKKALLVH